MATGKIHEICLAWSFLKFDYPQAQQEDRVAQPVIVAFYWFQMPWSCCEGQVKRMHPLFGRSQTPPPPYHAIDPRPKSNTDLRYLDHPEACSPLSNVPYESFSTITVDVPDLLVASSISDPYLSECHVTEESLSDISSVVTCSSTLSTSTATTFSSATDSCVDQAAALQRSSCPAPSFSLLLSDEVESYQDRVTCWLEWTDKS